MKPKIAVVILLSVLALVSAFFAGRLTRPAGRAAAPVKKKAVEPAVRQARKAAVPAPSARAQAPMIAIVMDDFGYNMNNVDSVFRIGEPVTLSILPGLPYSRRIAELASGNGYEAILHLPLESHRKDVREEYDTIRAGMTDEEVISKLQKEIQSVPGISGVSNHMGSKSTENAALMALILGYLKKNNLYFLDSLTSRRTVCKSVCGVLEVRYASRDVFLDNSSDAEYIKKQLAQARRIALKKGRSVAICHDRKNTVAVLAEEMPRMKQEGIRFVFLSELVK